ncbi:MAG: hydroxyethylthiazole kinase [Acetobacteraceae bacterium]
MPTDPAATPAAVAATLAAIRARAPLIHNITNFVVTNSTANALLALGASPAMVEGAEEVAVFAARADALVINLGTMSAPRAAAIRLAVAGARDAGVPWVLDPVAAGAIPQRTALARGLLMACPAVVRGNGSEIMALAGTGAAGRGVDSTAGAEAGLAAARQLAAEAGVIVAVTGAVDYVTDGRRTIALHNGHPMMTRVTGLGCTATALIGACLAVTRDPLAAAVHGLALLGVAGEIAAARAHGPGSLQMEILDALYALDADTLARTARMGGA